jgi:hypothetical protein
MCYLYFAHSSAKKNIIENLGRPQVEAGYKLYVRNLGLLVREVVGRGCGGSLRSFLISLYVYEKRAKDHISVFNKMTAQ